MIIDFGHRFSLYRSHWWFWTWLERQVLKRSIIICCHHRSWIEVASFICFFIKHKYLAWTLYSGYVHCSEWTSVCYFTARFSVIPLQQITLSFRFRVEIKRSWSYAGERQTRQPSYPSVGRRVRWLSNFLKFEKSYVPTIRSLSSSLSAQASSWEERNTAAWPPMRGGFMF